MQLTLRGASRLFDRPLVGEEFGEGERSGGPVVLAEEIEALDRGEDALGNGIAGLRRDEQPVVVEVGEVSDVHLDGRHAGQPEKVPRSAVGTAVT